MPREAFGVPHPDLHAPRPDRDDRLHARVVQCTVRRVAGGPFAEQPIGRRAPHRQARLAVAAADRVDHAVTAHRIADESGAGGVDASAQEAAGVGCGETRHFVEDEHLVERPVVQRARERLLVVVRAVGVIDGHDDEAFAGEILAEVAHQVTIAGIAVRQDHQRERPARGREGRITHGLPLQRHRDRRVSGDGVVGAARRLAWRERRRIPDLEHEPAGRTAPWASPSFVRRTSGRSRSMAVSVRTPTAEGP